MKVAMLCYCCICRVRSQHFPHHNIIITITPPAAAEDQLYYGKETFPAVHFVIISGGLCALLFNFHLRHVAVGEYNLLLL